MRELPFVHVKCLPCVRPAAACLTAALAGAGLFVWPAASAHAALVIDAPQPITDVLTVQPIIVSNDDGSNTAGYFGTESQQASIVSMIDGIWAQAGITVNWLAPNTWNNTFANVGTSDPRSTSDLTTVALDGKAAGVASPFNTVANVYFVEVSAGHKSYGGNTANGLAFVGGNGITMHVGDNLPTWQQGREVVASVMAHELGHNLGSSHIVEAENLMQSSGQPNQGEKLNSNQITKALNNSLTVTLGDLNGDGVADAADLPEYVLALTRPQTQAENTEVYAATVGDLDFNGLFDLDDARLAASMFPLVGQDAVNRTQNFIDLDLALDAIDDGLVNGSADNLFGTLLATGKTYEVGDSRGDLFGPDGAADGVVDAYDIDFLQSLIQAAQSGDLATAEALLGDQAVDGNGDGQWTADDVYIATGLADASAPIAAFDAQTWINGIGFVDDYVAIPEPNGVLVVAGVLCLFTRRRRPRPRKG